MVMLSRKFQFYLGIVNTFPAVFYIFLGIFSAFMHKISHSASPREKFYAFWQRKCQEKCRKQLEKWWQFLGKISTCLTLLPHVGNLYSSLAYHANIFYCMYLYYLSIFRALWYGTEMLHKVWCFQVPLSFSGIHHFLLYYNFKISFL